jgi:RNase H
MLLPGFFKLRIFTDSQYLINCWELWLDKWLNNGWKNSKNKEVANRSELENLLDASNNMSIEFVSLFELYFNNFILLRNATLIIIASKVIFEMVNIGSFFALCAFSTLIKGEFYLKNCM